MALAFLETPVVSLITHPLFSGWLWPTARRSFVASDGFKAFPLIRPSIIKWRQKQRVPPVLSILRRRCALVLHPALHRYRLPLSLRGPPSPPFRALSTSGSSACRSFNWT